MCMHLTKWKSALVDSTATDQWSKKEKKIAENCTQQQDADASNERWIDSIGLYVHAKINKIEKLLDTTTASERRSNFKFIRTREVYKRISSLLMFVDLKCSGWKWRKRWIKYEKKEEKKSKLRTEQERVHSCTLYNLIGGTCATASSCEYCHFRIADRFGVFNLIKIHFKLRKMWCDDGRLHENSGKCSMFHHWTLNDQNSFSSSHFNPIKNIFSEWLNRCHHITARLDRFCNRQHNYFFCRIKNCNCNTDKQFRRDYIDEEAPSRSDGNEKKKIVE